MEEVVLNNRKLNDIPQDKAFSTVVWKNDYKPFGL